LVTKIFAIFLMYYGRLLIAIHSAKEYNHIKAAL